MHSKTFIHQLHAILNEPHLQEWISWSADDDSVFILKPYDHDFSSLVLKRYFKHGNVSSFVRQLHMYGFHKLSNVPENTKSLNSKDRALTTWHFTHPLGFFKKDADLKTLKKIQRKSTGVGKDGKRKNVLSTVCVNYIEPTNGSNSLNNESDVGSGNIDIGGVHAAAPLQNQQQFISDTKRSHLSQRDRGHYTSLPLLPPAGSSLYNNVTPELPQYQNKHQPLLPHLHRREYLINKPRTISSPEIVQHPAIEQHVISSISSSIPGPTPSPAPLHASKSSHHTAGYLSNGKQSTFQPTNSQLAYITPNSSIVSSTSTSYHSMSEYQQHLENSLKILRNSIMLVTDMLPSLLKDISNHEATAPSGTHKPDYDSYMKILQNLKEEIISENAWSQTRHSQSSVTSSSVSGSVVPHLSVGNDRRTTYPSRGGPTPVASNPFMRPSNLSNKSDQHNSATSSQHQNAPSSSSPMLKKEGI